ncbi:MAG: ATP-binding protein [Candidatus Omnitrophica bacterium]|nr:ATP-binding protein [Candidatus Omnitrophota bacterium]
MFFASRKKIKKISEGLEKLVQTGNISGEKDKSRDQISRLEAAFGQVAGRIEQLEKENSQARAILNSMIEGVIALDRESRITSLNPTVEKIFGIDSKRVKGKFFLEAIPNNDLYEIISGVFKKKEAVSRELSLVWPVQRIFQVNATPIFDRQKVSGCTIVVHDITEMRKLETIRSDFVVNVSHELKTPLTSIKGFVETLIEGALEDKENAKHFLQIIQEHTDRLNNLVNDLLDLSYLESKVIQLQRQTFELKGLVDKVLGGFWVQIRKSFLVVNNEIPTGIFLEADQAKIEQVFVNLIDNAVKFNRDNGSIRLYSQEVDGKITVTIEDSGLGIPVKDLPRIFERFYRVDKARSRELGGTGLGLSIVKHIIELHQGTVGVESAEGFGSKFWFILPK